MALSIISTFSDAQRESLSALVRDTMTEESQKIFMEWFWPTILPSSAPYPVKGEKAQEWLEIEKKYNFKKMVVGMLDAGMDYEVFLNRQENPQGGRPSETINLTVKGFKKLGMMAQSAKGSLVRLYYLELENVVQNFVHMEMIQRVQESEQRVQLIQHNNRALQSEVETLAVQVQKKIQKAYEYGDTVYIAKGRYMSIVYHKVGSTVDMNSREKGYGSHTIDVEIMYTVRCHRRKILEDVVHEVLRAHTIAGKADCFDLPFEVVKEVVEAAQTFLDGTALVCQKVVDIGLSSKLSAILAIQDASSSAIDADAGEVILALDEIPSEGSDAADEEPEPESDYDTDEMAELELEPDLPAEIAPAAPVQIGDVIYVPPKNDPSNFDGFVEECFIKGQGTSTITDIQSRFRLWARAKRTKSKELEAHLKTAGYIKTLTYDPVDRTSNIAYRGLVMKPMPAISVPDQPDEIYDFLLEECTLIVSGRVASVDIKKAFEEWKQKNGDPSYIMTGPDKTRMNKVLNKEFLPGVYHTGERMRGGYAGVCLKGNEHIGRRKNLGNRKQIAEVDPITKTVLGIYDSATIACQELNLHAAGLSLAINNNTHTQGRYFVRLAAESEADNDDVE